MAAHQDQQAVKDVDVYAQVVSPTANAAELNDGVDATKKAEMHVRPTWVLYACVMVALVQPFQFGWSIPQLNLSTFNNEDDCNARPVVEGTCVMFPGHSKLEWTFVVNAWVVGGMIGSLFCGGPSDRFGRKKVLMANCAIMIAGAVLQAAAGNIWVFVVGRLVTGIASGCATAMVGGYIGEISPPHLRGVLGASFQMSVVLGILIVSSTFFFLNTSTGWRYISGFPIILAGLFLLGASTIMVESPTWLLSKGRRADAEKEIARLFGPENVQIALTWMEPAAATATNAENGTPTPEKLPIQEVAPEVDQKEASPLNLLLTKYRRQFIIAMAVAAAQQLSGINAVFFYSSDIFKDAGIKDDRVGSMIVDVVNVLPTMFVGVLLAYFPKRALLLNGMIGMFASAIGMTIAFVAKIEALSILFTATYVGAFGISLGPLVWGITAELFPDDIRANAVSICIFVNWTSNLVVGVGFPYIADALNHFSFVPFMVTLALFYFFLLATLPETSGKTIDEIQAEFRKAASPHGTNSSASDSEDRS